MGANPVDVLTNFTSDLGEGIRSGLNLDSAFGGGMLGDITNEINRGGKDFAKNVTDVGKNAIQGGANASGLNNEGAVADRQAAAEADKQAKADMQKRSDAEVFGKRRADQKRKYAGFSGRQGTILSSGSTVGAEQGRKTIIGA